MFDVQLDSKNQPQAVAIVSTGVQGTVSAATGSGETPRPRLPTHQIPCKFGTACKFGAACTYSHAGAPAAGQFGGMPFGGKGGFPQPFRQLTHADLPPAAQPVTLFGETGHFIPDSALIPQVQAGPRGIKRSAGKGGGPMPSRPRMDTSQIPCKFGAGCSRVATGTCTFLHEGVLPGQAMVVPNPGLDPSEPSYMGTVKSVLSRTTGYGFVESDALQALYPGQNGFLHAAMCPWAPAMSLGLGEPVLFNVFLNEKNQPQVSRIVRNST